MSAIRRVRSPVILSVGGTTEGSDAESKDPEDLSRDHAAAGSSLETLSFDFQFCQFWQSPLASWQSVVRLPSWSFVPFVVKGFGFSLSAITQPYRKTTPRSRRSSPRLRASAVKIFLIHAHPR